MDSVKHHVQNNLSLKLPGLYPKIQQLASDCHRTTAHSPDLARKRPAPPDYWEDIARPL